MTIDEALRQEGRLERDQQVAAKMLEKGLDPAFIHEVTDLPVEAIKHLMH